MSLDRPLAWRWLGYAALTPLALLPALQAEPAGAESRKPPCEACHVPSATPPAEETCTFFCKTRYYAQPEGKHASLPCTACHPAAQVGVVPHLTPVTPVDCGAVCHQAQARVVETTAHRAAALRGAGLQHPIAGKGQSACLSCHPPHAGEGYGEASFAAVNPRSQPCLACHSQDRSHAPQVRGYEHPLSVFGNEGPRWEALGTLPLFDRHGWKVPEGENGALTCNSCHSNHGPDAGPEHLRRPGWQKACAACHGPDSLFLYRYFHEPERRASVLAPSGTERSAPRPEAAPQPPADREAGH
jgi:hypothetical protein